MSHIPDDKRAKKSAGLIFKALIECIRLNTNQVNNIKILYAFGDTSFDYFINTVYGLLCAILTTWIQRGRQESAEEINEIFLKLTGFLI